MAKNRALYALPEPPVSPTKPAKAMPFATHIPHRWWSVDLCSIEKHRLPDVTGPVSIWTILDNYSRQIVASAPSTSQTLWAYLLVLFTAIHVHGAPLGLVSDGGAVFKANAALELYARLGSPGIEKEQIERRRPWRDWAELLREPVRGHETHGGLPARAGDELGGTLPGPRALRRRRPPLGTLRPPRARRRAPHAGRGPRGRQGPTRPHPHPSGAFRPAPV